MSSLATCPRERSPKSRVWLVLCNPKGSKAMVVHVNTDSAHASNPRAHCMTYMHWGDRQPLSACSELRREKKSPQVYSDFHGKCKLLKNIGHALWDSENGTGLIQVLLGHLLAVQ